MARYIDKDALVAEIEKLIERAKAERVLYPKTILAAKNYLLIEDYKKLLSFIDTLEVKEIGVDLELTWRDIAEIVKIANLLESEWLNNTPWDGIRDWGFYTEALKRYKEQKGEKV